ncbi:hypothetical protein FRB99_004265 [Tulasnella sp. 403]|nr:hypothetical protein FRB99_004265 [Tulasnella sp. 403]
MISVPLNRYQYDTEEYDPDVTQVQLEPRKEAPQLPRVVGSGSSSLIYLGRTFTSGGSSIQVVLKCGHASRSGQRDETLRELRQEEETWRYLGEHERILPFLGCGNGELLGSSQPLFYLCSPYMEHTDLFTYIRQLTSQDQDCDRPKYLSQTAEALDYIHSKGIVYGDMKAENILISGSDDAYICDFGSSYAEASPDPPSVNCTLRHMAPELFVPQEGEEILKSTKASDVYAFGMTIYQVLSGMDPFSDYGAEEEVREAVTSGERPPTDPSGSKEGDSYHELWVIAEDCWNQDPHERPSMGYVSRRLNNSPA